MLYLSSTSSSNGSVSITVTFETGTDVDQAATNVSNRVRLAEPRLPEEVRRNGVTVQKQSSNFLQIISMTSPEGRLDPLFISNYTTLNILEEIKRVPGVGSALLFGAKDFSMRIWLKPDRLALFGLTPADVATAIREQNAQFAVGRIGQEPTPGPLELSFTVTAPPRYTEPRQFEEIVLRSGSGGAQVRLADVARVELGARDYDTVSNVNGTPSINMAIFLQPGANSLATADGVQATMKEVAKRFPEGLAWATPYDSTRFVRVSIEEVVKTLLEAMVLVFLVVWVFLGSFRATLIPLMAVPVSLIGAFAGMYALGFSINTLTLFGLVLAIGIVVDDAIVVLENVERIQRAEKISPREAAFKAMTEVTGPVIAIVLVLVAVFLPVAFFGGLAGELYRQFAITIAISVFLSGVVALTLTPALCALLLRPEHIAPHGLLGKFDAWFQRRTDGFGTKVDFLIRHKALTVGLFLLAVLAVFGLLNVVPGGLVPSEDQGYFIAAALLPDGATLSRTAKVARAGRAGGAGGSGGRTHRLDRRLRLRRRRQQVERRHLLRHPQAVGRAPLPSAKLDQVLGRLLRQHRGDQGGGGLRLQSAADPGARRDRRLRVLRPESRRRRHAPDVGGGVRPDGQGEPAAGAGGRPHALPARRAAARGRRSTANAPRRRASRSTRSTPRCRAPSAPSTSTTSPAAAGPSGCSCRRRRSTGSRRTISGASSCAPPTAA